MKGLDDPSSAAAVIEMAVRDEKLCDFGRIPADVADRGDDRVEHLFFRIDRVDQDQTFARFQHIFRIQTIGFAELRHQGQFDRVTFLSGQSFSLLDFIMFTQDPVG